MSAWIVSKPHIDALVQSLIVEGFVPASEATATGRMLWEECRRSVAHRYPNDADGEWPGPVDFTTQSITDYRFEGVEAPLDDAVIAKNIDCYEYQSCEHGDEWRASEAKRLTHALALKIAERHGAGEQFNDDGTAYVDGWYRAPEPPVGTTFTPDDLPWGLDDIMQAVARSVVAS